jgi:hypothetical protein
MLNAFTSIRGSNLPEEMVGHVHLTSVLMQDSDLTNFNIRLD